MAREEKKYAAFNWPDTHQVISEWGAHYGVVVEVRLCTSIHGAAKGYVEVDLFDRTVVGKGEPLLTTRAPFSWAMRSGHPGIVAHAVYEAFAALENTPWRWPAGYRQRVTSSEA